MRPTRRPGRGTRRWVAFVTIAGALLTALALYVAHKPRGVYWSRVDVQFLLPYSTDNTNVIKTSSRSLVMTAGAVARMADPSGGKRRLADQNVSLASEGMRHGSSVTLPNRGSQWTNSFADPYVQVEVVGTTTDEVSAGMDVLLEKVTESLSMLQARSNVPAKNAIRLLYSPSPPAPMYYQADSPTRALVGITILGLGLTIAARTIVRNISAKRRTSAVDSADSAAGGSSRMRSVVTSGSSR